MITLFETLVELVGDAGRQAAPDQQPPAVILWPDPERQFLALAKRLRERFQTLILGPFDPDQSAGPAIWIRAALAARSDAGETLSETVPLVYMPGCSREMLREIADAPLEIQPLAELQFRGVTLGHKGRDWTITSLLGGPGVGLRIARDRSTRDAVARAFPLLLDDSVEVLRSAGELDAAYFDELLTPDGVRTLLLWLSDPPGTQAALSEDEWPAFVSMCRSTYGFDPDRDGPFTAAGSLGERKGPWLQVWQRFLEAPERYPGVAGQLTAAQPATLMLEGRDAWPLVNAEDEKGLRRALEKLEGMPGPDAAVEVKRLEEEHGPRRVWVWARLGLAPLALALEHLARLATGVGRPAPAAPAATLGSWYAESGWETDAAMMRALAAVEAAEDVRAVEIATRALYFEWVDAAARALQDAFTHDVPPAADEAEASVGTCVMFVDGLRLDIAHQVVDVVADRAAARVEWRFAAVPTVTPTAKPAVSPIAGSLFAGPQFSPSARPGGTALSTDGFRKVLADRGWHFVGDGSWGDPQGRGWTEGGDVDKQGHNLANKFPRRLTSEAVGIAEHAMNLLAFGWKRVVIVTDHGWLYMPGGLPKIELPIHATEARKGRCARVAAEAKVQVATYPWRWDPSVRIAVGTGIACFEAGKVYEHGGISPQESVTPRVLVEPLQAQVSASTASITNVKWVGLRCRLQIVGAPESAVVDVRTKPGDETTSLADEPKPVVEGSCSIVVPDDANEGHAAMVVVLDASGSLLAQRLTTVGGDDAS
ncbi:MAG: BREX-1 system phosphatase PglZ type B [Actinomycetota bacterium]